MEIAQRQLIFGPHRIAGNPAEAGRAPYIVAGRRMYILGHGSGELAPIGVEHLIGHMGGIWAHPVRVGDGIEARLETCSGEPMPAAEAALTERLNEVAWSWNSGPLHALRRDRVLPDAPACAICFSVENRGPAPVAGSLVVTAPLAFLGNWFSGVPVGEARYWRDGALLLGQDGLQPQWGLALGAHCAPDQCVITPGPSHTLVALTYHFNLAPGDRADWLLLLTVSHSGGAPAAALLWHDLLAAAWDLFAINGDAMTILKGLPRLECADQQLARDVALAQANLQMLWADYPDTGPYLLAGLPEYPQLFGCDTTYSVPGAAAGGFRAPIKSALETLAAYARRACGRVPHEITTNGRVFNPGNIQETPQLTIAVWDYLRWTGDLEFARRLFPLCHEGITELLPAHGGGGFYPYGDAMVERLGMGSRKLDSTCYAIAGLYALAKIAAAIGVDGTAYSERAATLNAAFERDWWIEAESLYGDSMHSDGRLQLDGHWTAVLPVQLGLASPERARRVLERLEREFINEWGMVHTRAREELVWTLPTGLMSLALFDHARAAQGLLLARNIARTAEHGTLGTFKELIPQGLCFIQLWSAGLYLQAIFEGLLGLRPDAPAHSLLIAPCMPAELPEVRVNDLRVGEHTVNLTISPRALRLTHCAGPQTLAVTYAGVTKLVAPGESLDRAVE